MEDEFIEEIESQIKTNFKINNIPISKLREFKKYCKEECNDCYSVGLIQLLRMKREYESILPFLSSLQNQINEIKNGNKNKRTFGG
jgi:biotin synthase-like enzyme